MKDENKSTQNISILGAVWQQNPLDERLCLAMKQKFDLDHALAQILAVKNIPLENVENFLNPSIKTSLPDPFELLDMQKAVDHAIDAIKNNKKITIFADYDVDGATSSSLLKRFFAQIGVDVGIYVPDRIQEGYGPNADALLKLKKQGTDLVITVDCGAVAFEPLEKAHEAGLEIIVIDHHIGVIEMPKALAIINPNRIDETFSHKNICAAAVSFLFVVALNKKLREIGFYEKKKEPNLLFLLDLVALGTVCDVMPLTDLNRAFVAQGLKILKKRQNVGLKALFDVAKLDEEPNAYHLGFILGPRINAGGRVGKSDLGATILSTNNEEKASEIAAQLDELNSQRKDIEKATLDEAINNLESAKNGFSVNDDVIFAVNNGWHAGVIGIVASRLKDLYNKPVSVIAIDENGKGKSSCRSIKGIDFGGAILKARLEGLVIEGGGHAMAGGFSVKEEKIKDLHQFFTKEMSEKIQQLRKENNKFYDIELDLANVNLEMIKSLQMLEPFGVGNAKPKFILRNLQKISSKIIGKDQSHISCNFSSLSNVGFSGFLQGVSFRSVDTVLGGILLDNKIKKMKIVGDLSINKFMGRETVQIIIEDVIL
jgi:single-stranded-DNA-specific exonuclease